jgi:GT2 family glycosyltransferase
VSTFAPWKVLHIELSEGIPTLTAEPKYQGIYVVFWWYAIPLGHEEISAAQLPMPASQLANLVVQTITPAVGDRLLDYGFKPPLPVISQNPSRDTPVDFQALMALQQPLKQLHQSCSQPVSASMSVIVCTRNRPEQLARCLRSLQNLSQPPQEIIVVDNAPSDDATRQLVAQMPGIQYVLEPRPGLSVARNTGIHHSTGDIIAFTDDDVIVHPDWSARLQQGFENPKVMAVTGLVLPGELETEAQVLFEKNFGGFSQGYRVLTFDSQFFQEMKHRGVPVWRIGAGANMAFRRKAFELVGDFDERLGAGASGCSEDSEFWYRILAEGWLCRYEPASVVYHYHRSDLDSLKQQMYQYMRGHVAALLVQFARYQHWGNLRRLFVALPKYYTRQFLSGLLNGFKSFNKMLLAQVLGCFSGVKFYLQHRYFTKVIIK